MIENKNILITGGTGFIGSNLVNALSNKNNIYCIIRTSSTIAQIRTLPNINFIIYENNPDHLKKQLSSCRIDICYHIASCFISEHSSHDQINQLINSNILFPTHLVDILYEIGVNKLINIGTSWQNYTNDAYNPVSLYAATKQSFEDILEYYHQARDISVITLRLYDTYGPNDTRNKLLTLLDKARINNIHLDMSLGEQFINLVYITDVIQALTLSADILFKTIDKINKIYGVYHKQSYSLREIVSEYQIVNNCKLDINWGGRGYRKREVMYPVFAFPNIPKWQATVDLQSGLKLIANQYT